MLSNYTFDALLQGQGIQSAETERQRGFRTLTTIVVRQMGASKHKLYYLNDPFLNLKKKC